MGQGGSLQVKKRVVSGSDSAEFKIKAPKKRDRPTHSYTTRKIRVVCELKQTDRQTNQDTMANFTAAINALVAERDRVFLERVAADYGLKYEELHAKYLETAEQAIKVPRKYTKKPKEVTVVTEGQAPAAPKAPKAKAEKQCCQAQTSKKEPCKFSALKGEVFCKRHLKASLEAADPKPATEAKKKAPAKKAPVEVVHTHTLDAAIHDDCQLCQTHGNPLVEAPQQFEVVVEKPKSVQDRLAELMADTDDEASESESDSEVGVEMGEEAYEEE